MGQPVTGDLERVEIHLCTSSLDVDVVSWDLGAYLPARWYLVTVNLEDLTVTGQYFA